MNMRLFVAATLATACLASPVLAQSQSDSSVPTIPLSQIEPRKLATAYEFVSVITSADDFEIRSSQMALERAASPEVKSFAQMLIADHTASTAKLVMLAATAKMTSGKPGLDGEQQGLIGKLEQVKGPDFDKLYIQAQVFAHQRAIAVFRGYQDGDSDFNKFAAETLPTLAKHYTMAVSLGEKLGAGKTVQ